MRPELVPVLPLAACLQTSTQQAYTYARDWGVLYGGSGKQLGMQVRLTKRRGCSSGSKALLVWADFKAK